MSTVFHFAENVGLQKKPIAHITNLLADDTVDVENVVLVATARGIRLLGKSTSEYPDKVSALIDRGVSFRACENSLEAFDMSEDELIDGVETVPSGVGELTELQARHDYAYITM